MDVDWKVKAECRGEAPELFFPLGRYGSRNRAKETREPLAMCARCPVRRDCASFAVRTGAAFGVFGGVDLGDGSKDSRGQQARLRQAAKRAAS